MLLRPYQAKLTTDVELDWAHGARNVLMRLGTGGGKTVILASIIKRHVGASCVIAHRQELVSQLSLTLARHGIRHNIIAAAPVRRFIAMLHIMELGQSFFDPGSQCVVASVDTLIRAENINSWAAQVTLWIVDEAHHVVENNKWHVCLKKFTHPKCIGLGPTATPRRADGKGLGRHADGVFDTMVQGPPERWLIEQGYLTPYRIVCPDCDMEVLGDVGASGDWSAKTLKEAAERSHIVGDVVENYLRWTPGKLGVTFSTDVDTAGRMAEAYRRAGVPAEVLTGKTDPTYRTQIIKNLGARRILQLVAVDIVSEGFDLPAIEVVSFARKTASLGLFMQQWRNLRPVYAAGPDLNTTQGRLEAIATGPKPHAWTIDHVANVLYHQGPPDKPRPWSLDRRAGSGGGGDGIPMRICGAGHSTTARAKLTADGFVPCYQPFERFHTECPYCTYPLPEPEPSGRTSPQTVEGDMVELDAETLARMRGDVAVVDMSLEDYHRQLVANGVPPIGVVGHVNKRKATQTAQAALRDAMAWFGGFRKAEGKSDRATQKEFFLAFGVDVLTAQALNRTDAEALTEKVRNYG